MHEPIRGPENIPDDDGYHNISTTDDVTKCVNGVTQIFEIADKYGSRNQAFLTTRTTQVHMKSLQTFNFRAIQNCRHHKCIGTQIRFLEKIEIVL